MTLMDIIQNRRSVRRYSSAAVPREAIDECLEAARLAPSACNSQPWSFIVVDDVRLREDLAKKAFSGIYRSNAFAGTAPVMIVVITEQSSYIAKLGGALRRVQYSLVDIGIACEHFVLRAAELGIGTCWLGWFNEKAVKDALSLPRSAKVDILISAGYPEEDERSPPKRRTLAQIRAFNAAPRD